MNRRHSNSAAGAMGQHAYRERREIPRLTRIVEIIRADGGAARVPLSLPRVFWLERPEPPQRPRA